MSVVITANATFIVSAAADHAMVLTTKTNFCKTLLTGIKLKYQPGEGWRYGISE